MEQDEKKQKKGVLLFFSNVTKFCPSSRRGGSILLLPRIIRTWGLGTLHHDIEYRTTHSVHIDRCELTSSPDLQTHFLHLTISSIQAIRFTRPSPYHRSFFRLHLLQLPPSRSLSRLPSTRYLQAKNRSHKIRTGRIPPQTIFNRSLQPRSNIKPPSIFQSVSFVLSQTPLRSFPFLPPPRDLSFHLPSLHSSNSRHHPRIDREGFHSRTG